MAAAARPSGSRRVRRRRRHTNDVSDTEVDQALVMLVCRGAARVVVAAAAAVVEGAAVEVEPLVRQLGLAPRNRLLREQVDF